MPIIAVFLYACWRLNRSFHPFEPSGMLWGQLFWVHIAHHSTAAQRETARNEKTLLTVLPGGDRHHTIICDEGVIVAAVLLCIVNDANRRWIVIWRVVRYLV